MKTLAYPDGTGSVADGGRVTAHEGAAVFRALLTAPPADHAMARRLP